MRQERQKDRRIKILLTVCFKLQNVISCPQAHFSISKLNLYDLTAHSSQTKKGYCALWTEAMSGRGANYIASAVMKILEQVVHDHPDATEIVTWSDSCVPQNRNSIIAFAMADFLTRHPKIKEDYNEVLHSRPLPSTRGR